MTNGSFDSAKARSDFLIAMYNQMFNDINTHIVVIWQSLSVLVGAFAAWSLIEKGTISLDFAVTLIIVLAIWVLAHVYDAAYWYNRNLVIIANIERQFLLVSDLKEIHYYFGAHRKTSAMLTHLQLQRALAVGLALLVFGIQFFKEILPQFSSCFRDLEFVQLLPFSAMIAGAWVWVWRARVGREKYAEFLRNSPGKSVDTTGVQYGIGHPVNPPS